VTYSPQGFAFDIFRKRYALHPTETFEEANDRVARHLASAEKGEGIAKTHRSILDMTNEGLFMFGGRIMYGSGRPRGQLLNCFVVPTEDSREGWGQTASDVLVISGTGGGVGVNCSPVRGRGSPIHGTGGTATGAVSLMRIINAVGEQIKAGGGRRTALMLCLDAKHGDLPEFLEAKLDLNELNNANVSVVFSENPEDYFARTRVDGMTNWAWETIVRNALKSGEPGILNGYYANRMSNIHYIAPLESTNPCGEIWLSAYDCCCLGALVLPRFIQEKATPVDGGHRSVKAIFNWDMLESAVHVAARALDNVLTVNHYPLSAIAETCSGIRRIGLGIMGLHDMLLMLGLRYNSDEGLELVNKTLKFIKNAAYEASIELAKEKGAFPRFDADRYLKSGFIRTLKPSIRSAIKQHGIRNCALLTIAPTGTTSMVQGVTSGIEPMFAPAYRRKYRDGDELKEEVVIHPLFKQFVEEGRDVSHFQGAHELSMRDHFEMQRVCQGHIDNAVSKTINVPAGTSADELSELYQEYLPHLKGVTVYPDGSRENQPLTPMPLNEALAHVGAQGIGIEAFGRDTCKDGKCDL
jgi:ribonucleoside-diphosphate reductase alpha chain